MKHFLEQKHKRGSNGKFTGSKLRPFHLGVRRGRTSTYSFGATKKYVTHQLTRQKQHKRKKGGATTLGR